MPFFHHHSLMLVGSEVLPAAPFPTHRPVCADFAFKPVRDSGCTMQVPREFPVSNCVPTPDAEVVYARHSSHIGKPGKLILMQGYVVEVYTDTAWTQLAEQGLACQCRRNGKAVGSSHFGRAEKPMPRPCPCPGRFGFSATGTCSVGSCRTLFMLD